MTASSLIINYVGQRLSVDDAWVRVEQIKPTGALKYATLADLAKMWLLATTGGSARLYRSGLCPVEFEGDTVRVFLGFYVWPSAPDLPYSLRLAMGTATGGQQIERLRHFSVFVDNRTDYALKYFMTGMTAVWETPTFNRVGVEIDPPTVTLDGNKLRFSREVFGCLRVSGTVVGFHHVAIMELSKPVDTEPEGVEAPTRPGGDNDIILGLPAYLQWNAPIIENLENIVTAVWMDNGEEETAEMRFEIPACVEALLAMCPDFYQTIVMLCQKVSTLAIRYNACTGELLSATPGKDPWNYCTVLADRETVTPNPWGLGTL